MRDGYRSVGRSTVPRSLGVVRPLIALTSRKSARADTWRVPVTAVGRTYLDAIVRAGGQPVVLPPIDATLDDLPATLRRFDGVCLPGGPDVDPARYGADEVHAVGGHRRRRPRRPRPRRRPHRGRARDAGARHLPGPPGAQRRARRHARPAHRGPPLRAPPRRAGARLARGGGDRPRGPGRALGPPPGDRPARRRPGRHRPRRRRHDRGGRAPRTLGASACSGTPRTRRPTTPTSNASSTPSWPPAACPSGAEPPWSSRCASPTRSTPRPSEDLPASE